jgi:hypothetical protein
MLEINFGIKEIETSRDSRKSKLSEKVKQRT